MEVAFQWGYNLAIGHYIESCWPSSCQSSLYYMTEGGYSFDLWLRDDYTKQMGPFLFASVVAVLPPSSLLPYLLIASWMSPGKLEASFLPLVTCLLASEGLPLVRVKAIISNPTGMGVIGIMKILLLSPSNP